METVFNDWLGEVPLTNTITEKDIKTVGKTIKEYVRGLYETTKEYKECLAQCRPLSAYAHFSIEMRATLQIVSEPGEITKKVALVWKNMSPSTKQKYQDLVKPVDPEDLEELEELKTEIIKTSCELETLMSFKDFLMEATS